MHQIGIISNPRSRAHLDGRAALGAGADGLPQAAPADRDALRLALAGFAAEGVDLLVVNGGDGTLREVLTALPLSWPGAMPAIAPLAAGRTNLAARALGLPGRGEAVLDRLRAAVAADRLRIQHRPVIEVEMPGGRMPQVLRGLLFGAAAFTEATLLASRRRGLKDGAAVLGTTLATVAQALSGRGAVGRRLQAGTPMRIAADAAEAVDGERFILLATTLDRLMLGLWPFWGEGLGAMRWLDVAAPPSRLGTGLWSLARRRAPVLPGWRSGRAERLRLRLEQAFVLDGEVFEPGPEGVILTASTPVAFAAP